MWLFKNITILSKILVIIKLCYETTPNIFIKEWSICIEVMFLYGQYKNNKIILFLTIYVIVLIHEHQYKVLHNIRI